MGGRKDCYFRKNEKIREIQYEADAQGLSFSDFLVRCFDYWKLEKIKEKERSGTIADLFRRH